MKVINIIGKDSGKDRGRKRRLNNGQFAKSRVPMKRQKLVNNDDFTTFTTENTGGPVWREGRRIVEIGHLVDQLSKGCSDCQEVLLLHNLISETKQGLGSIFHIQCVCGEMNSVRTGKTHRDPNKKQVGSPIWDINTKAATG